MKRLTLTLVLSLALSSEMAVAQGTTQILGGNVCPTGTTADDTCRCQPLSSPIPNTSNSECRVAHNDNNLRIGESVSASPS